MWGLTIYAGIAAFSTAFSLWMFFTRVGRIRWVMLAMAVITGGLVASDCALLALNAAADCYPWSSLDVPYSEGMTLCPGQTAVRQMRIEVRP